MAHFSLIYLLPFFFFDLFLSAAVPLTFDDNHFASVSTLVHSQLLDFKFRPAPNQHAPSPPPPVAMPVASAVGRASAVSTSPSPSPSPPPHPSASPPSASSAYALAAASSPAASSPSSPTAVYGRPAFPTHTLGQILFPRLLLARTPRNITPQSTMQLANDYHQLFLTALINSYNQLAHTFEIYSRHCVSGLQRGTLANLLHVPPLMLPPELSPPPHGSAAASSSSVCYSAQPGEERASVSTAHRGEKPRAAGTGHDEAAHSASSSSSTLSVPTSANDTLARSRRSSMESYAHELERHMSPGAEAEELRARFSMPPLYTLAYRIRNETGCCAWDEPDRATTLLLADLQSVSQQIFTLWNHFQQMLPHCTTQLTMFEHAKSEHPSAHQHARAMRLGADDSRLPPLFLSLTSIPVFVSFMFVSDSLSDGRARAWLDGATSYSARATKSKIDGAWATQTCQHTAREEKA